MSNGRGIRRSVSMRDGEYIALGLYKEELVKANPHNDYSRTGVLKMILFGEIPPIPQRLLVMGDRMAKENRKNKVNEPVKVVKKEPEVIERPGGGIFTF